MNAVLSVYQLLMGQLIEYCPLVCLWVGKLDRVRFDIHFNAFLNRGRWSLLPDSCCHPNNGYLCQAYYWLMFGKRKGI